MTQIEVGDLKTLREAIDTADMVVRSGPIYGDGGKTSARLKELLRVIDTEMERRPEPLFKIIPPLEVLGGGYIVFQCVTCYDKIEERIVLTSGELDQHAIAIHGSSIYTVDSSFMRQ